MRRPHCTHWPTAERSCGSHQTVVHWLLELTRLHHASVHDFPGCWVKLTSPDVVVHDQDPINHVGKSTDIIHGGFHPVPRKARLEWRARSMRPRVEHFASPARTAKSWPSHLPTLRFEVLPEHQGTPNRYQSHQGCIRGTRS